MLYLLSLGRIVARIGQQLTAFDVWYPGKYPYAATTPEPVAGVICSLCLLFKFARCYYTRIYRQDIIANGPHVPEDLAVNWSGVLAFWHIGHSGLCQVLQEINYTRLDFSGQSAAQGSCNASMRPDTSRNLALAPLRNTLTIPPVLE